MLHCCYFFSAQLTQYKDKSEKLKEVLLGKTLFNNIKQNWKMIGGLAITSDVRCRLLILHVFIHVNGKNNVDYKPLCRVY